MVMLHMYVCIAQIHELAFRLSVFISELLLGTYETISSISMYIPTMYIQSLAFPHTQFLLLDA